MSNDNKTLADVQPGGMVRLGDQAERARFEAWAQSKMNISRWKDGKYMSRYVQDKWEIWQAALSAQPSPGGQGGLNYERMFVDACAALAEVSRELGCDPEQGGAEPILAAIAELREALAARQPVASNQPSGNSGELDVDGARQPVGELRLPPDGFYKIVYDDAEVLDESFARSGALDAALRRFEQISNKWNAHLFVRFANNTRDCTVPNATPAQAVDLGKLPRAVEQLSNVSRTLVDWAADEQREAIGIVKALIDGKAVGNG